MQPTGRSSLTGEAARSPLAASGSITDTGGTVPGGTPHCFIECVCLREVTEFNPLDQQLRDPVPGFDRDHLTRVEVDQTDLDLSPVVGVDRSGSIHYRQSAAQSQSAPGVDESDVAQRKGESQPGTDQGPFTWFDDGSLQCGEVNSRIATVGAARADGTRVELAETDGRGGGGRISHPPNTTQHTTAPPSPHPDRRGYGCSRMARVSESVSNATRVVYRERQWVPWSWWIFGALIVALLTGQLAHNRSEIWLWAPGIILTGTAVWVLLSLSGTVISVEQDEEGVRWLHAGDAMLPDDAISRTLAVPASAKRNAMGRQLDPAAFVVSHGWVPEMAMFVLDDPEDPTPYWLIGSKDPEALIAAFLPERHGHDTD